MFPTIRRFIEISVASSSFTSSLRLMYNSGYFFFTFSSSDVSIGKGGTALTSPRHSGHLSELKVFRAKQTLQNECLQERVAGSYLKFNKDFES